MVMGYYPLFLEFVWTQQRGEHVDGHHDRTGDVEDGDHHRQTRLNSTA
jgi:hypothetical protein